VTLVTTVAERPVVLNTSRAPRRIPRRHIANLAPAIVAAALLLYATFFGAGPNQRSFPHSIRPPAP